MQRFINESYRDQIQNNYQGLVQKVRTTIDKTGLAVLEDFIPSRFFGELRQTRGPTYAAVLRGWKTKIPDRSRISRTPDSGRWLFPTS